jgi:hypothetical protein
MQSSWTWTVFCRGVKHDSETHVDTNQVLRTNAAVRANSWMIEIRHIDPHGNFHVNNKRPQNKTLTVGRGESHESRRASDPFVTRGVRSSSLHVPHASFSFQDTAANGRGGKAPSNYRRGWRRWQAESSDGYYLSRHVGDLHAPIS